MLLIIYLLKDKNALLFLFPFPSFSLPFSCSLLEQFNPKCIRLGLCKVGVPVGEWGKSHGSLCGMAEHHWRKVSLQGIDPTQDAGAPAVRGEPLWKGRGVAQSRVS